MFFTDRIGILCPNNWMKVLAKLPNHGSKNPIPKSDHHIFLDRVGSKIDMCGPYWNSLIEAFDIDEDDVISFEYNTSIECFEVRVTSSEGYIKNWAHFPKVSDIPIGCDSYLFNTYFDDIHDVTQNEMNGIVATMQVVKMESVDDDIIPKLYVYRLDANDIFRLEVPTEVFPNATEIPDRGEARYVWGDRAIPGSYKLFGDCIRFRYNWGAFTSDANLKVNDLIHVIVDIKEGFLILEVYKSEA